MNIFGKLNQDFTVNGDFQHWQLYYKSAVMVEAIYCELRKNPRHICDYKVKKWRNDECLKFKYCRKALFETENTLCAADDSA